MTMRTYAAIVVFVVAQLTASSIAIGSDVTVEKGDTAGYGLIVRKQATSKRVIFQPVEGQFVNETEIKYYSPSAEVICKGKISTIYRDEIYSIADECARFDDLMPGYGVAYNGESQKMLDVYRNRATYEANIREREWDRYLGIPMDIGEDQFSKMVKDSTLPVLVEFYVTWCPYCKKFESVIGEIAKDLSGRVRVATIDKEKNESLAKEYDVKSYPSLFLFKKGIVIDSWTGAHKTKDPVIKRVNNKIK